MSHPERTYAGLTAAGALERTRQRGATAHLLDAATLTSKRATLDAIAAALSFPKWTGRNLDALYDCLTDLSWLPAGEHVLIWSGHQVLAEHDPRAFDGVRAVLREAARHPVFDRTFIAVFTVD